jgi:hypothetical protein
MLCSVALVRTYVLEERTASIIRVKRIYGLGTLAVTSNRRTLLTAKAVPCSTILVTLIMEVIRSSEKSDFRRAIRHTSAIHPV